MAGPYLFCTLLVPPWLIRFKPEFLGPSAGSPPDDDTNNTKCIVEVRGLRGQISQFLLVEEGLVVVASQRSLFLLENLDVLNPPDEVALSAEVTSVCLAESISKEEAAEWYIVLIALNNGCIDYLRISKARSTLPLLLPPPSLPLVSLLRILIFSPSLSSFHIRTRVGMAETSGVGADKRNISLPRSCVGHSHACSLWQTFDGKFSFPHSATLSYNT